jgi:flagellar biosynthesis protein FlhG
MSLVPKVISITSGKGGVGKTNISVNLGLSLSQKGKKVLIIDADLGLANVNVLFNLKVNKTINDLIEGNSTINDILIEGPGGIKILPASSGIFSMSQIDDSGQHILLSHLSSLSDLFDYILIDTGAGIGKNVLFFNSISHYVLIVVTPEPTSITDAYALIKVLNSRSKIKRFKIIVNQVVSSGEGKKIYGALYGVVSKFLTVSLDYLGYIVADKYIQKSVLSQKPVLLYAPTSPSSLCINTIADRVEDKFQKVSQTGSIQLFWEKMVTNADF